MENVKLIHVVKEKIQQNILDIFRFGHNELLLLV
jgi:hypothetical protein